MESATAAGSSQSNISRIIFEKTKKATKNKTWQTSKMTTLTQTCCRNKIVIFHKWNNDNKNKQLLICQTKNSDFSQMEQR